MISKFSYKGLEQAVNPSGVNGLRILWSTEEGQTFYRQKVNGSLDFYGADFAVIEQLEGCCESGLLNLYRSCDVSAYLTPSIPGKGIEWNFATCSAKANNLEINDLYKGVYRYWETKVNMLKLTADRIIAHDYRKETLVSGEYVYSYDVKQNNRFRSWNSFIYYLIQQTFTGTSYASLIPSSAAYSEFFTATINPVTKTANLFLRSAIIQASDMVRPDSTDSATGVLQTGKENEKMSMNLKELLSDLFALFDCDWYIDPATNKFRIEHRLFFENGYSYDTPIIGMRLNADKFKEHTTHYSGGYRVDNDKLFGVQEIIFQTNTTLNSSQFAKEVPYVFDPVFPGFEKIDDFDNGNIKYDTDCANRNDKGELTRETRNVNLFYTNVGPVRTADESIDLTKWFLVEHKELIFPGLLNGPATIILSIASGRAERRNVDNVLNGNFTATALMRDYHRHGRPFGSGLMNYSDTVSNEKGIIRGMYSVARNKIVEKITVPLCCEDQAFNPHSLIILPDGQAGVLNTAEYNLSDETLTLEIRVSSACGSVIINPPTTNPGGCPPAKTFIRDDPKEFLCTEWINEPGGPYREIPTMGVWRYYADGFCGEYYEEINPCPLY